MINGNVGKIIFIEDYLSENSFDLSHDSIQKLSVMGNRKDGVCFDSGSLFPVYLFERKRNSIKNYFALF